MLFTHRQRQCLLLNGEGVHMEKTGDIRITPIGVIHCGLHAPADAPKNYTESSATRCSTRWMSRATAAPGPSPSFLTLIYIPMFAYSVEGKTTQQFPKGTES